MDEPTSSPQRTDTAVDSPSTTVRYKFGPSFRAYVGKSINLELSKEVGLILNQLMNQTDHDPQEIFVRAILLYKAAVEANLGGKRVVILDADDEIDQEFINL